MRDKYAGLPTELVKRYGLDKVPDDTLAQYRLLETILMKLDDYNSERAVEIRRMLKVLEAAVPGAEYMGVQMMSDHILGDE